MTLRAAGPSSKARTCKTPRPWAGGFILLVAVLGFLSCGQALPDHARVRRVIDGDTIELADRQLVRYIGIDAPELRRRQGTRWVEDPQPFSREAWEVNRRLVEDQTVRLEYDVETHDRYGRLLAYVYVGDRMVNAVLLEEGDARLLTIQPDVRYVERFRRLEEEARRRRKGLWADPADRTARARGEH